MKVGFTGSRHGMTEQQQEEFAKMIRTLLENMTEFHHGDCVGADQEAHNTVVFNSSLFDRPPVMMCLHPGPDDSPYRAWCTGGLIKQAMPKPYLDRNRDIVESVDFMIATPNSMEERKRGGTWYTIRYSKERKVDLCIIFPDGTLEGEVGIGY